MCISVCASVFVCSRVWARLQLRGEAIAIPTDLKTSLPATSKYRGMGKKRENVSEHQWSENTHLEIVASGRVEKIWKRKKKYPGAVRGLQKERDSTPPLHRWLKWEEWEDKKKKDRERKRRLTENDGRKCARGICTHPTGWKTSVRQFV